MRSFRRSALAFLIGAALSGPVFAGPYEDGVTALQAGRYDTAIETLLPLAEEGNAMAQIAVADAYLSRRGYNDDIRAAERWLRSPAEQGYVEAQYYLGWVYALPLYDDAAQSMKWYRLAAEQGHAPSQVALGIALKVNSPTKSKERGEAVQWLLKSAAQGHVEAYIRLSGHYRSGDGVQKDLAAAFTWQRLAAEQGRGYAGLAHMYQDGEGIPQDNVHAYMFYELASTQGDKSSEIYRDMVAAKMTQEQIAEARRLAREWQASHPRQP